MLLPAIPPFSAGKVSTGVRSSEPQCQRVGEPGLVGCPDTSERAGPVPLQGWREAWHNLDPNKNQRRPRGLVFASHRGRTLLEVSRSPRSGPGAPPRYDSVAGSPRFVYLCPALAWTGLMDSSRGGPRLLSVLGGWKVFFERQPGRLGARPSSGLGVKQMGRRGVGGLCSRQTRRESAGRRLWAEAGASPWSQLCPWSTRSSEQQSLTPESLSLNLMMKRTQWKLRGSEEGRSCRTVIPSRSMWPVSWGPDAGLGRESQEPGAFSPPSLVAGVGAAPFSGGTGFSPENLYTRQPQRSWGLQLARLVEAMCFSEQKGTQLSAASVFTLLALMTLKSLLFLLPCSVSMGTEWQVLSLLR